MYCFIGASVDGRLTFWCACFAKKVITLSLSLSLSLVVITSCAGGRRNATAPSKLTFDVLTLKLVSESRVTWATSVPILVFLSLSVLELIGPMCATDRQASDKSVA